VQGAGVKLAVQYLGFDQALNEAVFEQSRLTIVMRNSRIAINFG